MLLVSMVSMWPSTVTSQPLQHEDVHSAVVSFMNCVLLDPGLRIRITLIMPIRRSSFSLSMQIRILLLIKMIGICNHWSIVLQDSTVSL